MSDWLIVIGASVRAAASSVLRAGLQPWCADLFGDVDLRQRCPCIVIPSEHYPQGFVDVVAGAPPGPWMYTGGLENAPLVLKPLLQTRPLWGNGPETLARMRAPHVVQQLLRQHHLPVPQAIPTSGPLPERGRWLLKPYHGAGGSGVRFWDGESLSRRASRKYYLQEFIEGPSGAALFLGAPPNAHLLGITHQLVGEDWLHASRFHYCGSIGPWTLPSAARETLTAIAQTLVRETNLRGLFGLDFVLRDDIPWLVEVNPRYTASVEILEHALNFSAMALHRDVFVRTPTVEERLATDIVGKAIYFAPRLLTFPDDGPWMATLLQPPAIDSMPAFADIPAPGQVIKQGRPVLTFFARAG